MNEDVYDDDDDDDDDENEHVDANVVMMVMQSHLQTEKEL